VAGPRGMLEPAAARARVRTARYGVPTSAMAVEQTHNRAGGAVQPLEALEELRALADATGLHLHCDGARIWNASVATGVPLERYGRLFDSLSVCFSKGLGVLAADTDPDRVRLVFSYEVSAEEAERAAKVVVAAAQ